MTVQELIDQLILIEDKSKLVINEYDGWYNLFSSLATIDLYTSDDCTNLYDTFKEAAGRNDAKNVVTKHCILIDTSEGKGNYTSDTHKYFYTNTNE